MVPRSLFLGEMLGDGNREGRGNDTGGDGNGTRADGMEGGNATETDGENTAIDGNDGDGNGTVTITDDDVPDNATITMQVRQHRFGGDVDHEECDDKQGKDMKKCLSKITDKLAKWIGSSEEKDSHVKE